MASTSTTLVRPTQRPAPLWAALTSLAAPPTDGDGRKRDFGRVLTCIYYLNQGWSDEDGGHLRLHLPLPAPAAREGHSPCVDVRPAMDVMAVFRADRVMHEVRPCRTSRHRFAASIWVLAGPEETP